ncbi:site-specific DNA-methyltransferase [Prevotella copri]|uniref:Site-specific DNA-methyltransferase n=2 Tax=Prevotellaceae TaxID=171552 RepID=A0AAW4N0V8_9BACT|nr:site-specific DNA-methyltransferase [Segatella copri]MBU9908022.1 site-specific DNA-methyltransferase [Segatella copri]MBV3373504.1 site-specific DNA-methyltransferase [Segatella copri]MBV3387665.1 site-specific DNA-methyltransferase [Segatella copri]MBV3395514.1 site-specific DNA-methyltransferase [Segatella copri]MBV3405083.1 site-specific DNA-methyltransferase [Segatella copri]
MNKYELAKKINELEGLTNDEKSELIKLLRSQKKYGLVWEDKPEDAEQRMVNEQPVLVEVPERAILSDDAEAPNHILIEGDNLEALTALSYTHAGKIDVIYIDPPYNTGNKDFSYNDTFIDRENGYRHSMWLSFMDKRLEISKNLLSSRGTIFISIDDNELSQLKLLCDEIFGERNFIACPVRRRRKSQANLSKNISTIHEYVLIYRKNIEHELNKVEANLDLDSFKNPDNDPRGPYTTMPCTNRGGTKYSVVTPTGNVIEDEWRFKKQTYDQLFEDNRIVFPRGGKGKPRYKLFLSEKQRGGVIPNSWWDELESNQEGAALLKQILGEDAFSNPKPVGLITFIEKLSTLKDSTILDFFAGSGTTLHATMQLNAEDGGHRRCILATNNENGICENVTYERNRRVIQGYITPKGEKVPGLTRNNLRYYKTKFVPRDKSPKNLRNLMALSTDMLCIHNDTYIEKPFVDKNINNKIARYFESNDGSKRMLVIYRAEAIQALVELMKQEFKNGESKENGKLMVYVFSPNGYAYDDEFEDVADYVSLCAMPDAVLNAYRRVLPKKRQAQLLDDIAEETDSEARTVEESDLFQSQTYTMAASEIKDNREGGDE